MRPLLGAGPYLPWSTGAMRPAALVLVCNEIVLRDRTRIVECGSGASTVLLARLLRQRGDQGTITSIEHDAGWATLVSDLLRREGLLDVARVVYAPLESDPPWYRRAALTDLPEVIDLLVVDGPPAFAGGHGERRLPALAAFDPRLHPDATVFLDDAERPGERRVLDVWAATTSWTFVVDEGAGIATGRRSATR